MNVTLEPAGESHVRAILPNLRDREMRIVSGIADPARALVDEVRKSDDAFAVLVDGEIVCLWGIEARTILADAVYLWMLTSRAAEDHPLVFARHSRLMCEAILNEYGTIEGVVAIDNPRSVRWLDWLGASFGPSAIAGMLDFRLRRAA